MAPVHAETPARVVSINLCTDQLAMMLAREGQLVSVSHMALDPNVSAMADEARDYHINSGHAEEVYLLEPDLVLAGVYTPRTTIDMLRGLGVRVEIFDIERSLDGVRTQLEKMGRALNRPDAAQAMIARFDTRRAALEDASGPAPRAMLYYANGYTAGRETLAHEILSLAGFRNAAVEAGYSFGMKLPLEVLLMEQPDLVITPPPYPGGSRAEEVVRHPALRDFQAGLSAAALSDHDWVCDTPRVLDAAERLNALREQMTEAAGQ